MTQREYHKQINKMFYSYITQNFPEYEIDHSEGYGRIYIIPKNGFGDSIEYHQSKHDLCCMNYASESTKENMLEMENYINNTIIPYMDYINNNNQI